MELRETFPPRPPRPHLQALDQVGTAQINIPGRITSISRGARYRHVGAALGLALRRRCYDVDLGGGDGAVFGGPFVDCDDSAVRGCG